MRLFEAIIAANHRALAGDTTAGLHPSEFADELPIIALTCIDVRLNALLPAVLGIPEGDFIWLRNAGNIITSPLSSTMRSLALACAIKGGKEIAIIGHSDCQVGKTGTMELLDRFHSLGIERHSLPENLSEFFGNFGSDRQNVIRSTDIARNSPLISPKMAVHGLLVDVSTGKLEWLVNGYETPTAAAVRSHEVGHSGGQTIGVSKSMADFQIGEMKFPQAKIGESNLGAGAWLAEKLHTAEIHTPGLGAGSEHPPVLNKPPHPGPLAHHPATAVMVLPPQLGARIRPKGK